MPPKAKSKPSGPRTFTRPDGTTHDIPADSYVTAYDLLGTAALVGVAPADAKKLYVQINNNTLRIDMGWGSKEPHWWCLYDVTWEGMVDHVKWAIADAKAGKTVRVSRAEMDEIDALLREHNTLVVAANRPYVEGLHKVAVILRRLGWCSWRTSGELRGLEIEGKDGVVSGLPNIMAALTGRWDDAEQKEGLLAGVQAITDRRMQVNKPVLNITLDNPDLLEVLLDKWATFGRLRQGTKKEHVDAVVDALNMLVRRRKRMKECNDSDLGQWLPSAKESLRLLKSDLAYLREHEPESGYIEELEDKIGAIEALVEGKKRVREDDDVGEVVDTKRAKEVIEVLDDDDIKGVVEAAVQAAKGEGADPRDVALAKLARFLPVPTTDGMTTPPLSSENEDLQ